MTRPQSLAIALLFPLLAGILAACATSPTGRSQLMLVSPESAIVESRKAYISTVRQLDAGRLHCAAAAERLWERA